MVELYPLATDIPIEVRPYVASILACYRPMPTAFLRNYWNGPVGDAADAYRTALIYSTLALPTECDVELRRSDRDGGIVFGSVALGHVIAAVEMFNAVRVASGQSQARLCFPGYAPGLHPDAPSLLDAQS